MADINRIKVVLVEKKKTNKWLAEQLSKDPATVSKWCTNKYFNKNSKTSRNRYSGINKQ